VEDAFLAAGAPGEPAASTGKPSTADTYMSAAGVRADADAGAAIAFHPPVVKESTMPTKIHPTRDVKARYRAPPTPVLVEAPALLFVMGPTLRGRGARWR
jgi:hypothetical protein